MDRVNHPCIRFLGWQSASHLGQLRGRLAAIASPTNGTFSNVKTKIHQQTGNFDTIALDHKTADPAFKIVIRFPDDRIAMHPYFGRRARRRQILDTLFD
jgi:hypothetical protein